MKSSYVNVGMFGHVDCGKTTFCKSISSIASTACFDKHKESKERGITIDLGFSMYTIENEKEIVNVCLVDLPGHSSLIRTVLGGSQIIDCVFLMVDMNKGIQPQTLEGYVIAKVLNKPILVLLNKVDQYRENNKNSEDKIEKFKKQLQKKISKNVLPISSKNLTKQNIHEINSFILEHKISNTPPSSSSSKNDEFLFLFDHCFPAKGKGTVFTGTVLKGTLKLHDQIFVLSSSSAVADTSYKVQSLESFHQQFPSVSVGNRVGVLIRGYDKKKGKAKERGYIVKEQGTLQSIDKMIMKIEVVSYYPSAIKSKEQFHFSIGHQMIVGTITLFDQNQYFIERINDKKKKKRKNKQQQKDLSSSSLFCLVEFQQSLKILNDEMICIASKLANSQVNKSACRLAFHGTILTNEMIHSQFRQAKKEDAIDSFEVYKEKEKKCYIDRVNDDQHVIGNGLNPQNQKKKMISNFYIGKKIYYIHQEEEEEGESSRRIEGIIESSFGSSGKFRVSFTSKLPPNVKKGDSLSLFFKKNVLGGKNEKWK